MKRLRQLWCLLVGHRAEWYQANSIYHQRCKCCMIELQPKGNPFGW